MSDFEHFCHGEKFEQLAAIMEKLRAPNGCPWDKEQTHESLKKYLLEETYEVLDALDREDDSAFCDELGDLLLQVMFHAQLAREGHRFTIDDVVDGICQKMIRRHPHVFQAETVGDSSEVLTMWEAIKAQERKSSGEPKKRGLMDINSNMPALLMAQKVQDKAHRVGVDFDDVTSAQSAIRNDLARVETESSQEEKQQLLGEMLFTVVNLSRLLGIDAEMALRQTTKRFMSRFEQMEQKLVKEGRQWGEANQETILKLWRETE